MIDNNAVLKVRAYEILMITIDIPHVEKIWNIFKVFSDVSFRHRVWYTRVYCKENHTIRSYGNSLLNEKEDPDILARPC